MLTVRDGIDPETAQWAASVCGGHIGRARHLARDAEARGRRERVLAVPLGLRGLGDAFAAAASWTAPPRRRRPTSAASATPPSARSWAIAMGAGGVGKGVAAAARGARAAEKELEKRQQVAQHPHPARRAGPGAGRPRRVLPRRPRRRRPARRCR